MKAFDYLINGRIIEIDGTHYGYIEDRMYFVVFNQDYTSAVTLECEVKVNELLRRLEGFRPSKREGSENYRKMPSSYWEHKQLTSEYDFSAFPTGICPRCFEPCNADNCIKIGKYGYCPNCNRRLYKAVRFDGVREDGYPLERAPREKKEKIVEPEIDPTELYESGKLKTRKIKVSVNLFGQIN